MIAHLICVLTDWPIPYSYLPLKAGAATKPGAWKNSIPSPEPCCSVQAWKLPRWPLRIRSFQFCPQQYS